MALLKTLVNFFASIFLKSKKKSNNVKNKKEVKNNVVKNANKFSSLTNKKYSANSNEPKEKVNKNVNSNSDKLGSFEILSVNPQQTIISGEFKNGKEIIEEQLRSLEEVNTKTLLNKINTFKNMNLELIPDEELSDAIGDIILFNLFHTLAITEGTHIYRARNHTFQYRRAYDYFRSASDVWYPDPKFITKMGRLNKVNQPIMYASFDALTPIHEIRSQNNSQFALMKYEIKSRHQLNMMCIATEEGTPLGNKLGSHYNLSKKAKENWRIINNFLISEFTKSVPAGKEYLYRSTNELLRSFDMPGCDGFIYPSIVRGKGYNLAIKPAAADRSIDFIGLAYLYNEDYEGKFDTKKIKEYDFFIHQYWSKSLNGNKISYEPEGPCKIEFHKALRIKENETQRFKPDDFL